MRLSSVQSSDIMGSIKRLLVKVLRIGPNDVQTPYEMGPAGLDSRPVKGMQALYTETGVKGETRIIGYLISNRLANIGEARLFSTDDQGALKTYIWLKNNEDILLGGDQDNAVRYSPLQTQIDQLKQDLTTNFTAIQTGIAAAGGSYTPTPITIDISQAKADHIKTP